MKSRDALIGAFVEASGISRLLLLAKDGAARPVRIATAQQDGFTTLGAIHFRKASHAEMTLAQALLGFQAEGVVDDGGWVDLAAEEICARIAAAGSELGADILSADAIERIAATAVDHVLLRVERARIEGGLKEVNQRYKLYRQRQVAKGEKAIGYSAHLAEFTKSLVVAAAQHASRL